MVRTRPVIAQTVTYTSRNQHAIVREGPDNPGARLAGACTFQDKNIGQYHA